MLIAIHRWFEQQANKLERQLAEEKSRIVKEEKRVGALVKQVAALEHDLEAEKERAEQQAVDKQEEADRLQRELEEVTAGAGTSQAEASKRRKQVLGCFCWPSIYTCVHARMMMHKQMADMGLMPSPLCH